MGDFDSAIEKSEENYSFYYLIRGICYGLLLYFKESMHDLSVAIQLDENLEMAYEFRARCAFML